ncbi:MAG: carbon-nitrogen hydrolase family protein [Promethearchaeota archaeon]
MSSREKRCITVAACQVHCMDDDREGNMRRIAGALESLKGMVDVACFPETSIFGWVNPNAHDQATEIPGEISSRLSDLARIHKVMICIGLAEKVNTKHGEKLYDSAVLIDNTGEILMVHRKNIILTKLMNPPYSKGKQASVVDTRFGRIGILICADTFKKKLLKKMGKLNPDIVLVPYGWAARESEWPEHGKHLAKTVSNAAVMIGAPVVGTDLIGEITHGPWKGYTYGGQSVISDKVGNVLGVAKDRESDVLIREIEL